MYSRVVLVPEERLGIVVLTNSMTAIPTALCNRIVDTYLGSQPRDWATEELERYRQQRQKFYDRIKKATTPRGADTKPSLPLEAYTGTYASRMYGDVTITLEADHLVLTMVPTKHFVADLTHLQFDTFVMHWREELAWFEEGTAQFLLDAAGRAVELKLNVPNDDLWFDELQLNRRPPPTPTQ